jgi:hypothetical protein
MKKIYLLLSAAVITSASFAQTEQGKVVVNETRTITKTIGNDKAVNDTLGWVPNGNWVPAEFAVAGAVYNYGYTGGGYIYGVNISVNEISHCAQGYLNLNSASIGVEGVLLGFVGKEASGGGNSSMNVNIYNMAANTAVGDDGSGGPAINAMGPTATPLATTTLSFANADTNWFSLSYAQFSSMVSITGDFAVSMDASGVKTASDTVGLASDTDGEGAKLAFHYVPSQSLWYQTDFIFGGLDNNIALFPVIDDNFVGIEDLEFYNNMQISAFPNPAVNETTISYRLAESMESVTLVIMDMTGREVYKEVMGQKSAGLYNVNLDISEYNAGNYFYSLVSNGSRLTKRMVVIK